MKHDGPKQPDTIVFRGGHVLIQWIVHVLGKRQVTDATTSEASAILVRDSEPSDTE
jgi:hypothetical protein